MRFFVTRTDEERTEWRILGSRIEAFRELAAICKIVCCMLAHLALRLISSLLSSQCEFERKWVPSLLCRRKWSVAAAGGFPRRGAPTNGTVMEHCCESSRIHALTCTSTNLHTTNKMGGKGVKNKDFLRSFPLIPQQGELR